MTVPYDVKESAVVAGGPGAKYNGYAHSFAGMGVQFLLFTAIELGMGEAAEILTKGQRVYPKKAVELGYEFRYARLIPALESILGGDM